jgi:hypothetical protein
MAFNLTTLDPLRLDKRPDAPNRGISRSVPSLLMCFRSETCRKTREIIWHWHLTPCFIKETSGQSLSGTFLTMFHARRYR